MRNARKSVKSTGKTILGHSEDIPVERHISKLAKILTIIY